VTTYPDHILRMGSQQLAELKRKAAEFERQLWDAHESLEYEVAQSSFAPQDVADAQQEALLWGPGDARPDGIDGLPPTAGAHTRGPGPRRRRARRAGASPGGPYGRPGQPR
jgi:uncharacterized protein YdcH (DUF465 family)